MARGLRCTGRVFRARRAIWTIGLASAALTVAAAAAPNALGAERLAIRLAAAVKSLPRKAPVVPPALLHGRFYNGTPAVGALFSTSSGRPGPALLHRQRGGQPGR